MNTSLPFSFWEKEAFSTFYDLIVIGAGITGCATAYFYKKKHPDHRVLVLERGWLPMGASTKNAGFACIGSVSELLDDLGHATQTEVMDRVKLRWKGLQKLRHIIGDRTMDYTPCGGFELFEDEHVMNECFDAIPVLNDWIEEVTGEKHCYEISNFEGQKVIFNRLEGALHPGKMMREWAAKCCSLGVEFRYNSKVNSVTDAQVHLDTITLEAYQIVVATNGFSSSLLPNIPIKPGRGLVLLTHPIANLPWKGTFHARKGYIYFRNIGDQLLIGGARDVDVKGEETTEFGVNKIIRKSLIEFAQTHLNLAIETNIDMEWSGIMGFSPHKHPFLKRLSPSTVIVAGLSGMGVAMGTQLGFYALTLLESD